MDMQVITFLLMEFYSSVRPSTVIGKNNERRAAGEYMQMKDIEIRKMGPMDYDTHIDATIFKVRKSYVVVHLEILNNLNLQSHDHLHPLHLRLIIKSPKRLHNAHLNFANWLIPLAFTQGYFRHEVGNTLLFLSCCIADYVSVLSIRLYGMCGLMRAMYYILTLIV